MNERLNFKQGFGCQIVKPSGFIPKATPEMLEAILFGGEFHMEVFDNKNRRVNILDFHNGITDEGMTDLLTTYFDEGTPVTTWYFGLIAGTGTLAATDTLASHAGWTEFTDYTGDRKAWVPTAPAARAIGTSTTSDFAITGSGTLKGAFLCAVDTGTSGVLWSTGLFSGDQPVENGNTIKMSYALSG